MKRSKEPLVRIRGVSKSYLEGGRSHVVLERIDAEIERGELVVLLGKSGSGKTTLLNLLAGVDLPTAGDVVIDGIALNRLSEHDRTLFRRHRLGFVFQFFNLLPTLTVEENLLLPIELKRRLRRADRNLARDLLAAVGLPTRARSYPDRLSGGEQQRVAIARALVHEPDLLLADEPTGNLDLDTAVEVLDLLDRLVRESGGTMIMATHSRDVIGVADRIFRIENGRLTRQPRPGQ